VLSLIVWQGNAGLGLSVLIILLTAGVALIAALSAIGVCERCNMESGGVYFLIGHVLGARTSAAIGVVYCFGQVPISSLFVHLFIFKPLIRWLKYWMKKDNVSDGQVLKGNVTIYISVTVIKQAGKLGTEVNHHAAWYVYTAD